MWSFHDKVLSIIIPKNVVLLILVIIKFVIVIWNAICFYYYYYYYYYINWRKVVLLQFSDRRLLLNHSIISFMTKIVLFLNYSGFVFDIMILVSSANSTELANLFIADGKSLIYIRKSKGPSTEPCETPWFTHSHVEDNLLILVLWYLLAK